MLRCLVKSVGIKTWDCHGRQAKNACLALFAKTLRGITGMWHPKDGCLAYFGCGKHNTLAWRKFCFRWRWSMRKYVQLKVRKRLKNHEFGDCHSQQWQLKLWCLTEYYLTVWSLINSTYVPGMQGLNGGITEKYQLGGYGERKIRNSKRQIAGQKRREIRNSKWQIAGQKRREIRNSKWQIAGQKRREN